MGKSSSLTIEELLERAEKARREGDALARQFAALRELRTLEDDFRAVARNLATTVRRFGVPLSGEELEQLLMEAEDLITPPPRI